MRDCSLLSRKCRRPVHAAAFAGFLLGLLFTPVLQAQDAAPVLTPLPREVHGVAFRPASTVLVVSEASNSEDLFAAQDLTLALQSRGLRTDLASELPSLTIHLVRSGSNEGKSVLAAEHLALDAPMHEEGYVITPHDKDIYVIADTGAGLFYGAQTLKQMAADAPHAPGLWVGTVRDWPAMRYRVIQDDLSRGPFPTLAYQKHQLDVFAAHKANFYTPYFEHTLAYSADPLPAPAGSSLSRTEAHELVLYAQQRHITIIPEQEAFGHLHHRLIFEKYADLAETPHGHVFAPGQAGSMPLIRSWFSQIAEDFPSPFLHVGADETFDLGTGRTRAEVEKNGLGPVYAQFLTDIHTALQPLDKRLLFWGDVAESDPSAVPHLPKDMIAIPWIYWHKDSYDNDILPFKKEGIETWVAPGDANWRVVYPLGKTALDNISGFVEAGQRLGSTGELLAVWNDDGEGLYNQDWFGVLFGAAAAWQPGRSDGAAYVASFGPTFFGDSTGRLNEAQRELMAAEDGLDVGDDAFWMDPWTPEGQAMLTKWKATIGPARLHAERALELLHALQNSPDIREQDALAAMELGARRIDFIGLKMQLGQEMTDAYARAYSLRNDKAHSTEARELMYSISSMNGKCQDLRDGYASLKEAYRASWLAENRPYWLENVLVRYDLRIELWQKRGEQVDTLINRWQKTHVLPAPTAVGLPGMSGE